MVLRLFTAAIKQAAFQGAGAASFYRRSTITPHQTYTTSTDSQANLVESRQKTARMYELLLQSQPGLSKLDDTVKKFNSGQILRRDSEVVRALVVDLANLLEAKNFSLDEASAHHLKNNVESTLCDIIGSRFSWCFNNVCSREALGKFDDFPSQIMRIITLSNL